MDQKYAKYVKMFHILAEFKQEQNIINGCLNKSIDEGSVQVYMGPSNFVIIDQKFINYNWK